jgi:hypothetical protein
MPYIVRKDLTAQDLAIPVLNTDEYYTDYEMLQLEFLGWADEIPYDDDENGYVPTYEDNDDGSVAKFRTPKGEIVYLYSIDLEWQEPS